MTTEHELSDDEYLFSIGDTKQATTIPITVGNTVIPVIIDSGASVNVLDSATFGKLAENFVLRRSTVKIYPSTINQITVGSTQAIVDKHDAVFRGVGRLKDYQLKIHIDPEVTPVAQPQRRVPFHVRKDVEKKLQELQDLDLIEDVEGPTPWVSPLVAVPKSNGDVRVCVNMCSANKAVIRERYPIPTLEETLAALNGAAVFSKLDLRWGYHQVELHPESRALTTFSTHKGLKGYKCLIFGLSSEPEMYQYVIQQTLQGIPGARNISDDIIVLALTRRVMTKT